MDIRPPAPVVIIDPAMGRFGNIISFVIEVPATVKDVRAAAAKM